MAKTRRRVVTIEIDMEIRRSADEPTTIRKLMDHIEEASIGYSDAAIPEIYEMHRVTLVGKRNSPDHPKKESR